MDELRDKLAALTASHAKMWNALNGLVMAVDDLDAENGDRNLFVSAGCVDCTDGVTPDKHNTGLCAYHRAIAALCNPLAREVDDERAHRD